MKTVPTLAQVDTGAMEELSVTMKLHYDGTTGLRRHPHNRRRIWYKK